MTAGSKGNAYSFGVYVKKFPFVVGGEEIYSSIRKEEINSIGDEEKKEQSFYSWKLLEYAVKDFFEADITKLTFTKNEYGKWLCENFYFSISHSGSLVAVAVSKKPIGVDVEKVDKLRFSSEKMLKILTERESSELIVTAEVLNELWTVKEAFFKKKGEGAFFPKKIDSLKVERVTKKIKSDREEFYLSVVCDDLTNGFFDDTL